MQRSFGSGVRHNTKANLAFLGCVAFVQGLCHAEDAPFILVYIKDGFRTAIHASEVSEGKKSDAWTYVVPTSGDPFEIQDVTMIESIALDRLQSPYNIHSQSEADSLPQRKAQVDKFIAAYPCARPLLEPIAKALDLDRQKWQSGLKKLNGIWISAADFQSRYEPTNKKEDGELITFVTTDGKQFKDVRLRRKDDIGITVAHPDGISRIPFDVLPSDIRKRFGYDPMKAAAARKIEDEAHTAKATTMDQSAGIPEDPPQCEAPMPEQLDKALGVFNPSLDLPEWEMPKQYYSSPGSTRLSSKAQQAILQKRASLSRPPIPLLGGFGKVPWRATSSQARLNAPALLESASQAAGQESSLDDRIRFIADTFGIQLPAPPHTEIYFGYDISKDPSSEAALVRLIEYIFIKNRLAATLVTFRDSADLVAESLVSKYGAPTPVELPASKSGGIRRALQDVLWAGAMNFLQDEQGLVDEQVTHVSWTGEHGSLAAHYTKLTMDIDRVVENLKREAMMSAIEKGIVHDKDELNDMLQMVRSHLQKTAPVLQKLAAIRLLYYSPQEVATGVSIVEEAAAEKAKANAASSEPKRRLIQTDF